MSAVLGRAPSVVMLRLGALAHGRDNNFQFRATSRVCGARRRLSSAARLAGVQSTGDYSYALYVYSFPVQQTLMLRWPGLEPTGLFALSLPLVLAVAAISWHALERPALTLKSRFPGPRESP